MIEPKFILPGILFPLTLVFGLRLSHVGRPYNDLLFNLHKLIALACVVLLDVQFSKMPQAPDGQMVVLLVVSALCVIALFVSGAMMSAGKLEYNLMLTIHRIAPRTCLRPDPAADFAAGAGRPVRGGTFPGAVGG